MKKNILSILFIALSFSAHSVEKESRKYVPATSVGDLTPKFVKEKDALWALQAKPLRGKVIKRIYAKDAITIIGFVLEHGPAKHRQIVAIDPDLDSMPFVTIRFIKHELPNVLKVNAMVEVFYWGGGGSESTDHADKIILKKINQN
jgi:hypothetical protein